MADDIASHPENPYPGTIFNSPNGKDVYANVPKVLYLSSRTLILNSNEEFLFRIILAGMLQLEISWQL